MGATADVVLQGRPGDDLCRPDAVAKVDQHGYELGLAVKIVNPVLEVIDVRPGTLQPPESADDADIVPHCRLYGYPVLVHQGGVDIFDALGELPRRYVRFLVGSVAVKVPGNVLRGADTPHQPLQERRRGKPVGAMKARCRDLPRRVQVFEGRFPPGIGLYAAATVMRRGDDGDRYLLYVDVEGEAPLVDHGKTFLDIDLRVGSDVEIDVIIAAPDHFLVHGPGNFIPGGEVSQFGIPRHEGNTVLCFQPRALAAKGLGDEKAVGVLVEERGGVKLNVFHVDKSRACAVGHGEAVSRRYRGVGGVQIDPPQAARGEHRVGGKKALHVARLIVEDIGADALGFPVKGQRACGMMRYCQKVDGGITGKGPDITVFRHFRYQGGFDGLAR